MTAVLETQGLGKRYRRLWARADCTLSVPAGHVMGLVGPNGAGKTTLLNLAAGLLAPTTGTIGVLGGPAPASPRSWPGSGSSPRTRRSTPGCRSPITSPSARTSTRAGTKSWPAAGSTGWTWTGPRRPGSCPAGPARADPGHRQAAGVAAPGRAGGQPGPAGPAGVPAGPDGVRRRAGPVGGAVLAPGRGPGTGLRLPDRAGRLAGTGRRASRGAAGHPSPAHRPAPGPGQLAGRPAGHLGQPHRPADHAAGGAPVARGSTRQIGRAHV